MGGPREGHLQILPCCGRNVDMNDPRWPSLREAARRFLREDGCTLSVPIEWRGMLGKSFNWLQTMPSKIDLPKVVIGN